MVDRWRKSSRQDMERLLFSRAFLASSVKSGFGWCHMIKGVWLRPVPDWVGFEKVRHIKVPHQSSNFLDWKQIVSLEVKPSLPESSGGRDHRSRSGDCRAVGFSPTYYHFRKCPTRVLYPLVLQLCPVNLVLRPPVDISDSQRPFPAI